MNADQIAAAAVDNIDLRLEYSLTTEERAAAILEVKAAIEKAVAADELYVALSKAKDTIRAFHGEAAWDIYNENSPEMKLINAALSLRAAQAS